MSLKTLYIIFLVNIIYSQWNNDAICDDLVTKSCTLPWPNDYWLLKDNQYNAIHLNLSQNNFPIGIDGGKVNPFDYNIFNGFSPLPNILAYFDDLSIDNCARLWNISQSNDIDSPVIILHTKTLKRIPHWVELDHSSDQPITGNEPNRTLMIWPAQRLYII